MLTPKSAEWETKPIMDKELGYYVDMLNIRITSGVRGAHPLARRRPR